MTRLFVGQPRLHRVRQKPISRMSQSVTIRHNKNFVPNLGKWDQIPGRAQDEVVRKIHKRGKSLLGYFQSSPLWQLPLITSCPSVRGQNLSRSPGSARVSSSLLLMMCLLRKPTGFMIYLLCQTPTLPYHNFCKNDGNELNGRIFCKKLDEIGPVDKRPSTN